MNDKTLNIKTFLEDRSAKSRAKTIVVNKYRIPPQEFEDLLFEALATAAEWWEPNGASSWFSSVFITLESACLMYKRKNRKGYLLTTFDYSRDMEGNHDVEKEVHYRCLFNRVIQRIGEVDDEEKRMLLINILVKGEKYEDVTDNSTAARKTVERFRSELKEEFGEEMKF